MVLLLDEGPVVQTVAIPLFNARDIFWLCMEGLCNQDKTSHPWEILLAQEAHSNAIKVGDIFPYIDRLYEKGCRRVGYTGIPEWIPLPQKWAKLGQHAHKNSQSFLLQATDCFSPSIRLNLTHKKITEEGFQWIDFNKGHFYNTFTGQLMLYKGGGKTNLNMAFKTLYSRNIPHSVLKKGVDYFLHKHCNPLRVYHENTLFLDSLDTDGCNCISLGRRRKYINPSPPFSTTDESLDSLLLPSNVKTRLISMLTPCLA